MWKKDLEKAKEALKELNGFEIRIDETSQAPDINLMKGSCFIGINIIRQDGDFLVNRWVVPKGFVGNVFDYVLWVLKLYDAKFKGGNFPIILTKTFVRISYKIPFRKSLISFFELLLERFDSYFIKQAFPISYLKETRIINYYGEKVKIPWNTEEYLAFRYGDDWRTPKRVQKRIGWKEIVGYDKALSICSFEEFKKIVNNRKSL